VDAKSGLTGSVQMERSVEHDTDLRAIASPCYETQMVSPAVIHMILQLSCSKRGNGWLFLLLVLLDQPILERSAAASLNVFECSTGAYPELDFERSINGVP
jgi:hypothetical protein